MTDETNPRILAKRIEMIAWNLAPVRKEEEQRAEALGVAPIAQTADTVTLRRGDYDALVRLIPPPIGDELIEAMSEAVAYMGGAPGNTVTHTVHEKDGCK